MQRFRRWSRRLGLSFLALVLALLVGEGMVRAMDLATPAIYSADREVGRRYERGLDRPVYVKEARRKIHLKFNSEGYRGPDRAKSKPAGVRRVAVIGDSMTLAIAVEEHETMAAQLELLLNESHPEQAWEVLNFGASAASTGQELAVFREVARHYEPDLVVCAFYIGNDVSDNSSELSSRRRIYFERDEEGQLVKVPLPAAAVASSSWLNRNSHLYVWQKKAFRKAKRKVEAMAEHQAPRDRVFLDEPGEAWQRGWDLTRDLLAMFRSEVEAEGAQFHLLFIPSSPQLYAERWQEAQDSAQGQPLTRSGPQDRVEAICREAGIPLVALTETFLEREESQPADSADWLFFLRQGHMTAAGNALAARVLHAHLVESFPSDSSEASAEASPR